MSTFKTKKYIRNLFIVVLMYHQLYLLLREFVNVL